jgi:hypothetical protein
MQLESTALLLWEEEQPRYKETSINLLESSPSEPLFQTLPEPPARKEPAAVTEQQREVVLMAPVDISRGHCNAKVMTLVKKRNNIRLPPRAANHAVVIQDCY